MNRERKAATVDEIAAQIEAADAVFAVDYRGLSVPQAAALRSRLREADATFRVVKNTLTLRAADRAGSDALKALLDGPTALTFVRGDAALAARALADSARATSVLDFKGGVLDGSALSAEDVSAIARLPTRDVLYAQLVGTVAHPLGGLVRALGALVGGLAVQLREIADRGLVGGGGAAAPGPAEPDAGAGAAPDNPHENPPDAASHPEQAPASKEDA